MKPRIVFLTKVLDGSPVCLQLLDTVKRLSESFEIVVAMSGPPHEHNIEQLKKFSAVAVLEQLPQAVNDAISSLAGLCWDARALYRTWPFLYKNLCDMIQVQIIDIHPGALAFGHAPRFSMPSGTTKPIEITTVDIGITATQRYPSNLHTTILSARAAGFVNRIHICAEPGSELYKVSPEDGSIHPEWFKWIQNPEQLGQWKNWLQCIKVLLDTSNQPMIMLCEDDICFSAEAGHLLMQAQKLPRVGCWSFYSPVRNYLSGGHSESGWFPLRESNPWGALALCFPRPVLEKVYEMAIKTGPCSYKPDEELASDGGYLVKLGLHLYTHAPSLVDHLGYHSTLGHEHWADSVGIRCRPGIANA